MSSGLYSHTTRGVGTVLTAAIYNSDHQNHITNQNPQMTGGLSDDVSQMQAMSSPGGVGSEDLAGNLEGEIRRLRYMIDAIVGGAQWYSTPPVSLTDVAGGEFDSLVVAEDVAFTGDLTPTQISANTNNYAPTDHATALRFRLSTDASRNLTGLAGPQPGRIVNLQNIGSFNIVLKNQDTNSTDVNRFNFGGDITLKPTEGLVLQYDSTTQRWRPFGGVKLDNLAVVGTLGVAGASSLVDLSQTGFHELTEMSAPSSPAANSVRVYCKDNEELFMKRSDGSERVLGGAELIATLSPTSGQTADFDSLVLTSFQKIELVYDGVLPNTNAQFIISLSDDAGSSFENILGFNHSSTGGDLVTRATQQTASTGQVISRADITNTDTDMYGIVEIWQPGLAATRKMGRTFLSWNSSGTWASNFSTFCSVSMNAINKIRLDWTSTATFTAGTIKLFGLR